MAIAVRGSAWDPFTAVVRQLDSDFDAMMRRAFTGGQASSTGFVPAVNVDRDGRDVVITVELPGIDIDKLDVEVAEHRLRISGRREEARSGSAEHVLVREIRTGEFRREFALPEHVTADALEADYANGMLKVRVRDVAKPKAEPRKIEIRDASAAPAQATPAEPMTVEGSAEGTDR